MSENTGREVTVSEREDVARRYPDPGKPELWRCEGGGHEMSVQVEGREDVSIPVMVGWKIFEFRAGELYGPYSRTLFHQNRMNHAKPYPTQAGLLGPARLYGFHAYTTKADARRQLARYYPSPLVIRKVILEEVFERGRDATFRVNHDSPGYTEPMVVVSHRARLDPAYEAIHDREEG